MPKGQDYSIKEKQIFFRVIDFVEREKAGPTIPLHNTTGRLLAMLGIGQNSLFKLKKELADQCQKQQDEQEKQQFLRSRRRTTFNNELARLLRKRCWSTVSYNMSSAVPAPLPLYKKDNSGRPALHLSKLAEYTIRYHFHLLLMSSQTHVCYRPLGTPFLSEENISYSRKVLSHIHDEHPDFPIPSETTLWRHKKRLGFCYKQTRKMTAPLDSVSFIAQRSVYFLCLDDLRTLRTFIYYHDET